VSATGNVVGGNISTAGSVSATGNVVGNVVQATGSFMIMPTAAFDPLSPVLGAFYFNTANNTIRVWTGSSWVSR